MKEIEINNIKETIIERTDYPIERCSEILKDETTAILGYGPQGKGQGLNMRDQGFKVIIGLRKGRSWDRALEDGWVEGETLFETEEAASRGTIIQYLLSDAGQIQMWPMVKANLKSSDALYFSHGFGIVFREHTQIVPPPNVDVILVAPKGSGLTVRTHFQAGRGINSSYAIHHDATGRARDRCIATAFAIGSGHLQGAFLAQYEVLRENGHSPSEAYNETIEEALESLYPLVSEKGMDWMYSNCSTTAQRGALDWAPKFHKALKPVIAECYSSVTSGKEAQISIESNSKADYREKLEQELEAVNNQEMWQAGRQLRPLRPENL